MYVKGKETSAEEHEIIMFGKHEGIVGEGNFSSYMLSPSNKLHGQTCSYNSLLPGRLQAPKHQSENSNHRRPTSEISYFPPSPPEQAAEDDRPCRSAKLAPTPQRTKHFTPLALLCLEAPQTVQPCDHCRARYCEQRSGAVKTSLRLHICQQEERESTSHDANADDSQWWKTSDNAAL